MKIVKKLTALLLAAAASVSISACGGDDNKNKNKGGIKYPNYGEEIVVKGDFSSNAEVWVATASEKIIATESKQSYAKFASNTITVSAVKNEYESAQIVVSAKNNLKYTVELSDLTHTQDASAKITKDNFEIFTQQYIYVASNSHRNGMPTGYYPDALLPQANAVAYHKNVVQAGRNGAAWVQFYIPKETKAGVYTGSAKVVIGDDSATVPVEVKVYDYTLSDETTSKSVFRQPEGDIQRCELDYSEEILEKYNLYMAKHRLSTYSMENYTSIEEEVEKAVKLVQAGMSTIWCGFGTQSQGGFSVTSSQGMKDVVLAFALRSLEDEYDYVAHLVQYCARIDEPFFINYANGRVEAEVKWFQIALQETYDYIAADERFQTEFGKQVVESIKGIPNIVTDYYEMDKHRSKPVLRADGTEYSYAGEDVVLCPKPDGLDSAEERAQYDQFKEKWLYTCNVPVYPYPTYHIDDTMASHASLGWMMAEYDFVGNLYWHTCAWYVVNGSSDLEDPYAMADRGIGINGEGWLLYPGKMYEVDGPVGSVRLKAILDGNEDYELIRDLKDLYAEKGEDASDLINSISKLFYRESSITGGSLEYEQARELLLAALCAANSETGLIIGDIEKVKDENSGESYKVSAKVADGAELYSSGEKLTANGGVYTFMVNLDKDKNSLDLKAVKGSTTSAFSLYIGGKMTKYSADTLDLTMFTGKIDDGSLEDGYFFVTASAPENENDRRMINLEYEDAFSLLGAMTKSVRIYVYNPTDTTAEITVFAEYSDYGKVSITTSVLNPGANEINLDVFGTVNWAERGSVDAISFSVKGLDVYGIGNIFVFNK